MKKAAFASFIISLTLCGGLRSETAQPSAPALQINTGGGQWTELGQFSPDGKWFYSTGNGSIFVWDVASGRMLHSYRGKTAGSFDWARFSDSGQLAAYSTDRPAADKTAKPQCVIRIADMASERVIMDIPDPASGQSKYSEQYRVCAVSTDRKLVAASSKKKIVVFDAPSEKERLTLGGMFSGHKADVSLLRFSPDGSMLASASDDGAIMLWNTASGKIIRELPSSGTAPSSLDFAAGGKFLKITQGSSSAYLSLTDGTKSDSLPAGTVITDEEQAFSGAFLKLSGMSASAQVIDDVIRVSPEGSGKRLPSPSPAFRNGCNLRSAFRAPTPRWPRFCSRTGRSFSSTCPRERTFQPSRPSTRTSSEIRSSP